VEGLEVRSGEEATNYVERLILIVPAVFNERVDIGTVIEVPCPNAVRMIGDFDRVVTS
jgi:hypothetical protein